MEDILVIKPNRSAMLFKTLLGTVILGLIFWMGMYSILNPESVLGEKVGLLAWVLCPVSLWFTGALIIRCLPGQGDLTLTPKGFEINNIFQRSKKKYLWNEVTGFYISTTYVSSRELKYVCFDVSYTSTSNRRKPLSSFTYDQTNEQLAQIMNHWKERYGPNSPDIELHPVIDQMPEKGPSFLKRVAIQIGMLIPLGILVWVYFTYFATLDIRIKNNTTEPMQDVAISTFKTDTKQTNRYHIAKLAPGQIAEIKTPFLEFGLIKVKYGEANEQENTCTVLQHQQCTWSSDDIIFLEPNGQIATNSTYCQSIDDLAPIASASCDTEIDGFTNEAKISVEEARLKPVKKPALKNPETTPAYIATLQQEIQKHFHPPTLKYKTFPIVLFDIQKDGSIENIKLKASSQNQGLDDAALNAVYAVKSLPPLPKDLKKPPVHVEFNFDFTSHKKSRDK